jgi:hypothetical protein
MAYWCCARAEFRGEDKARHFLGLNGYGSYVPLVRSQRIRRGRRSEKIEPLFPSYIFIAPGWTMVGRALVCGRAHGDHVWRPARTGARSCPR